jgi:MFS family permease
MRRPGSARRAAAIIVFGFNGGMIAGAAIGSLLVQDVAPVGVFAIGAVTALLLAAYAAWAIAAPPARSGAAMTFGRMLRDIPGAFASLGFLRALLLIGAPAKAVLTGAVGFALPLLLGGLGWAPEDIGQIIMLYAAGVLLSGGAAARFVDRTQRSGATPGTGRTGLGACPRLHRPDRTVDAITDPAGPAGGRRHTATGPGAWLHQRAGDHLYCRHWRRRDTGRQWVQRHCIVWWNAPAMCWARCWPDNCCC